MTLEQLLAQAKAKASALLDKADAESGGVMTPEQKAEFDGLVAEIEDLNNQVEARRKFSEVSDSLEQSVGRKTAPQAPAARKPVVEVKEMVEDDPMRGFTSASDFGVAVMNASLHGEYDDRLRVLGAPTSPHKETGSSDGYMVPPQMRNEIYEVAYEDDDLQLLNLVDSEETAGNSVELGRDESTAYGSTGVQAYWSGENTAMAESNLDTEGSTVKVNKLYAYVTATEELIEDAPRLNSRLTRGAGRAINWKANEAIVNGSGSGQPLGYRNSGALVSVAKESGQSADTIVVANLSKMYSRLLNPSQGVWVANVDIFPQLVGLTIGDQPVFSMPNGIVGAPNGTLFGRPIVFTEHAQTLGDAGDINFVNPRGYYMIRKAAGIKFASSMHLYFDRDVQAFRWTFRMGGQPFLSAPVSPNKGSATKSHFVELAARA